MKQQHIWSEIHHDTGAVQRVRIPVVVVTVTTQQARLGLGA